MKSNPTEIVFNFTKFLLFSFFMSSSFSDVMNILSQDQNAYQFRLKITLFFKKKRRKTNKKRFQVELNFISGCDNNRKFNGLTWLCKSQSGGKFFVGLFKDIFLFFRNKMLYSNCSLSGWGRRKEKKGKSCVDFIFPHIVISRDNT